jgi:hypothetical protein
MVRPPLPAPGRILTGDLRERVVSPRGDVHTCGLRGLRHLLREGGVHHHEQMPHEAWRGMVDGRCVTTAQPLARDLREHCGTRAVNQGSQVPDCRSRQRLQTRIHTGMGGRWLRPIAL